MKVDKFTNEFNGGLINGRMRPTIVMAVLRYLYYWDLVVFGLA